MRRWPGDVNSATTALTPASRRSECPDPGMVSVRIQVGPVRRQAQSAQYDQPGPGFTSRHTSERPASRTCLARDGGRSSSACWLRREPCKDSKARPTLQRSSCAQPARKAGLRLMSSRCLWQERKRVPVHDSVRALARDPLSGERALTGRDNRTDDPPTRVPADPAAVPPQLDAGEVELTADMLTSRVGRRGNPRRETARWRFRARQSPGRRRRSLST